jgi:hypothetical protein
LAKRPDDAVVSSLWAATDGLAQDLKTPPTRIKARHELAVLYGSGASQGEVLAESSHDLDAMVELISGPLALARADATTRWPIDTADSFLESGNLHHDKGFCEDDRKSYSNECDDCTSCRDDVDGQAEHRTDYEIMHYPEL